MLSDSVLLLDTPAALAEALHTKYPSSSKSLDILAEDATLFWNAMILWTEIGSVGDAAWNDLLRSKDDDNLDTPSSFEPEEDTRPPCKFFSSGGCKFGPSCRFSHGSASTSSAPSRSHAPRASSGPTPGFYPTSAPPGAPPCKFFSSGQACKFGDKCRFAHIVFTSAAPSAPSPSFGEPEPDADEFDEDEAAFEIMLSGDFEKDFYNPCQTCGSLPTVAGTGLCGKCCFGKSDW